ncbi:Ski-like protein,Ski oncogene,Transforming protein Ski [Lepeophtheirus salmonis]|uniref:Ski-like protein,Ski oncogene,Transforming protein Ski n=1 Tax=Lepeophtheirus salmonis TaxID=72036 RepID=A0A7R8H2U8_LEPSM|nr:Ski-like protein,Ski oncogene,Transforming protein Ski [Lepeophtheirus salmonis]CAF2819283.1 Ski-like protein,Ski oncogene,Transforming protein Ski [Lepeophtheirus salmonis]
MTEEKADRVKELLECYMDSAGRSLTGPSGGCGYSLPPDVELSLERECMGPSVWSVGGKRRRSVREKKTPALESGRSGRHLSGEMIRRILERQKAVEKGEDVKGLRVEGAVGLKGHPVLLSRDPGTAEYKETFLWGERIACFNVGGEQRCCLPQILNSILDSISLQAIHAVCDDLRIYCPTCTPDQLELLKSFKVIPLTASQCGLITKSDAERIFSVLLDRQPPRFLLPSSVTLYLKVVHDCFGRNYGLLIPQLYTHQFANCVQCIDCGGAFNPQRFVCHVHSYSSEKRTVHWGFDSSHWRTYLRLCESSYTQETNEYLHSIQDSGGKKNLDHPQFQAYNNIYNLYNSWAAIVSKSLQGGFPFSSLHARLFEAKSDDNLKSLPENTTKFREGKKEEECNDILNKNLNMSLADDINAIRDALEGASAVAKDRTLKTLERITARLAQTEIERDIAIANYNELQKQNCCTQEELFKKRAELRELLAQDTSPHSNKNRPSNLCSSPKSLCDKMKDSDDLRDRMVFMEAELRALRNELKIRMLNESSKGDEKRITPDQSLHFANSSTVMSNKKQFKSE